MKRASQQMTPQDALAWRNPRRVLAAAGLLAKRSLSQNFLVDRHVVERIAAAAAAIGPRQVIEIGAGTGVLTAALLRQGLSVIAIEIDRELVALLQQLATATPSLQVLQADASSLDWPELLGRQALPPTVVGNLPYALTGALLRPLIEASDGLAALLVMVQEEVADRLVAAAGTEHYGALSIFAQARFAVRKCFRVAPQAFFPPPKVCSTVVELRPLARPRAALSSVFSLLVHAAFQQRRKTLRNAWREIACGELAAADLLPELGIDAQRRGETLSIEEFASVSQRLSSLPGVVERARRGKK